MPGNVKLTTTASGFVLDIQVEGNLDGMANLEVSGLNGTLHLGGDLHIHADVVLHLIVGVDLRRARSSIRIRTIRRFQSAISSRKVE